MIGATVRHTANPTMLEAGYKQNVIPGKATAYLDCRFLPGGEERFLAELDELVGPEVAIETVQRQIAYETSFDGVAGRRDDGRARGRGPGGPLRAVLPVRRAPTPSRSPSSASAASASRRCGCRPTSTSSGMFHGIDERVPLESLRFGARVLSRFLASS